MQRVVVIGSGDGGTFTANLLALELRDEIRGGLASVQLIGEHLKHPFQPGNLDVAFKGASPDKYVKDETDLLRKEVEFIQDPAVRIDLQGRSVTTKSGRTLDYNFLVIATGAVADPSKVPGLSDGALNFHTGAVDSQRIWESIKSFQGGTIVVAIAGTPHKCPPSPNEAAFMLDEYFHKRGIREKVNIKFLTPYPRPYPAEKISRVVEPLFKERGIDVSTFFNVDAVDPAAKKIYSLEGEVVQYDMLIAIPPHHGADVIINSGIGDEDGYVPTDRGTMRVEGQEGVYAIGDATNIPVSKSGVVAHLQSVVVAHNIVSEINKTAEFLEYNGRINCPMEVGSHRAIFVSATYTSPPTDQTPSVVKYLMKRSFAMIYWRALNGSLERIFDGFFGQTRFPLQIENKEVKSVVGAEAAAGKAGQGR
ncbi:MAG TPA: FAD/NAD(P)-binding oxidoreductase [Candidatus Acidoferrales bacterium]|nr:FAD/NAD(P)-binding oxidoreductase [Candidatus Acidoferrales bacterium]